MPAEAPEKYFHRRQPWLPTAAPPPTTPSARPGPSLCFLPPYSPDFNPMETAFSKFEAYLKRRAARTVNELWDAIGQATDIFSPAECENYFAAAGYDRV